MVSEELGAAGYGSDDMDLSDFDLPTVSPKPKAKQEKKKSKKKGRGIEPEEKKQTKKQERDPNAPKKPSNSYQQFCKAKRDEVKASHQPELGFGEISKELGSMWKAPRHPGRQGGILEETGANSTSYICM